MQERNFSGHTALIVGDMAGIGREFAQLAAIDGYGLMLVDDSAAVLRAIRLTLGPAAGPLVLVEEALDAPSLATELLDNADFYALFHPGFTFPEVAIHIMTFDRAMAGWDDDPFSEAGLLEPRLPLSTVLDLNEALFARYRQQQGDILNVLVRPPDLSGFGLEMYNQSLALLLDLASHHNRQARQGTAITHTFAYDGATLALQSQGAHAAPDRLPATASARDLAAYGYQVLSAGRAQPLRPTGS